MFSAVNTEKFPVFGVGYIYPLIPPKGYYLKICLDWSFFLYLFTDTIVNTNCKTEIHPFYSDYENNFKKQLTYRYIPTIKCTICERIVLKGDICYKHRVANKECKSKIICSKLSSYKSEDKKNINSPIFIN